MNLPQGLGQPGAPGGGRPEAAGIQPGGRLEETEPAIGHRPGGNALIEEGAAEPDEQRVHERIRVERRLHSEDQIPVSHGGPHQADAGTSHGRRLHAGVPEVGAYAALVVDVVLVHPRVGCLSSRILVAVWEPPLAAAARAAAARQQSSAHLG